MIVASESAPALPDEQGYYLPNYYLPAIKPAGAAKQYTEQFVETLQNLEPREGIFNPWRDFDPANDFGPEAPQIRRDNLLEYLRLRLNAAKVLLIGEAPGYQGAKRCGIAMTSERILLDRVPEVPSNFVIGKRGRQTSRPEVLPNGAAEPTATIAWKQMLQLGYKPHEFVFWNAFPCHPHKPGQPLTNRAPTAADVAAASHVLPAMLHLFPGARVVAVGNVAKRTLEAMGVVAPCVRHPANGGATKFRNQLADLDRLYAA